MVKYPRQIKSCITSTKDSDQTTHTLCIENYLQATNEKTIMGGVMQSPMEIFTPYSCFKLTIIQKTNVNKKFVYANIPLKDFAEVKAETESLNHMLMYEKFFTNVEEEPNQSIGYTKTISIGKFKGKTPAEVLLENNENLNELLNTAEWLKKNISYKGNQAQIDAIEDAVSLYKQGMLNADRIKKNTRSIELYNKYKTLNKKRNDGKQLIYSIILEYRKENELPIHITITNYYAMCNGIIPDMNTKEDETRLHMAISKADWMDVLEKMEDVKQIYLNVYGKYELTRMFDNLKANMNIEDTVYYEE